MTNHEFPTQDSISRISGLELSLKMALRALAVHEGKNARAKLEALRDEAISCFKNADIVAERELDHARVTKPAIEVIEIVFDSVIDQLR
jgi:hypothetical protein